MIVDRIKVGCAIRQRAKDNTARVVKKRNPQADMKAQDKPEAANVLTRQHDPLEGITCKTGDNTCAAKHVSDIQRGGLFHPMNGRQRIQSLLRLQQKYGNRFVQKVIAQHTIQTKLKMGQPGDKYEQEADRVVKQVMQMPEPQVRRQPSTEEGQVQRPKLLASKKALLAHELAHAVQKWFNRFEQSVIFVLSRLYIERKDIPVKQVEDFKDRDDRVSPAHYNPDDRTIYFSKSGFGFIYEDRVSKKKIWAERDYYDFVAETAAHEAFHAYQDTPRHRSKKFAEFEKDVVEKLRKEFVELVESGIMDTYEEFKGYIPAFTSKYLPESKIKEFMGENLPGFHRDPKWQLSAREEIMNQWLHILEDQYLRARALVSGLKKGRTGKGLKEEKRHEVSMIEKQAEKFAKMRKNEVKLWLLARELEKEKDAGKQAELRKEIKLLKAEVDLKNIPQLEKRKEDLEAEFMKLDPNKKAELQRSAQIAKELMELEDRLDALISLRDGIEAIFKRKGLLIPK